MPWRDKLLRRLSVGFIAPDNKMRKQPSANKSRVAVLFHDNLHATISTWKMLDHSPCSGCVNLETWFIVDPSWKQPQFTAYYSFIWKEKAGLIWRTIYWKEVWNSSGITKELLLIDSPFQMNQCTKVLYSHFCINLPPKTNPIGNDYVFIWKETAGFTGRASFRNKYKKLAASHRKCRCPLLPLSPVN